MPNGLGLPCLSTGNSECPCGQSRPAAKESKQKGALVKSNETALWEHLSEMLEDKLSSFPGLAGLCLRDLTSGEEIRIHADLVSPSASTIKMHILAHLLELSEAGDLDWFERIKLDRSVSVPGSGVLAYFDDPVELTVRDVATLMIIVSDNTATNLCIDWATIDGVNEMLGRLGLTSTILQRKMQDHDSVREGNENLSTPADVVRFLDLLYSGQGLSPSVCAETIRILKKPKRGYMSPALPEGTVIASKPGGMDKVRNDAGIVYQERRPYALCIMTAYGLGDRRLGETLIGDTVNFIHGYMTMLDRSGPWGQGVPLAFLAGSAATQTAV
jgi:beta-lactamase class A